MRETRTFDHTVELRTDGEEEKIVGTAIVFYDEGDEGTEFILWDDRGKYEGGVLMKERIMPSAMAGRMKDDIRALVNHDPSMLLGRSNGKTKTLRLSKDAEGLHYEIEPSKTRLHEDTMESIRRGDMSGSSFAFTIAPKGQRFKDEGDDVTVREITKFAQVFDVSAVTFPAYEATDAGVRGSDGMKEARDAFTAHREAIEAERAAEAKVIQDSLDAHNERIDELEEIISRLPY